jgi:hypothetical protein
MDKGNLGVRFINHPGKPIRIGEATLTPQSQAVVLRWPNGGFIWNRPVAVTVEQGGEVRSVPILDITRLIQVSLWALAIILFIRAAGRWR